MDHDRGRYRPHGVGAVSDPGAHGLTHWPAERLAGHAGELHARPLASGRLVEVLDVTAAALVLGSAQPDAVARPRNDVEVVRRRTGGGAVLLVPGEFTWIDVTIPRGDPLHDDDVGRAFHWLGETWAAALGALGLDPVVHTGPPVASPWSSTICFAGIGSGEVVSDDRKVVGLSQRRTRAASRFQSVVFHRWDPDALLALLAVDDALGASNFLLRHAAAVPAAHDAVVAAFLAALP